jgi:hypothetical protein
MDFRFIAAGILAGAIGFVGGSTVFADASRPPADPTIAGLAAERHAADAAAAVVLPPPAKLPALPRPPKVLKIPVAVARRVIVVHVRARRTTAAKRTVIHHKATPKPKHVVTHKSVTQHPSDTHHETEPQEPQDDHGQGD